MLKRLFSFASLENTVNGHLFRVNFEVLLVVVLVPFLLMFESSYGNAWVFSGGHLVGLSDGNTWVALFRGFALEGFIFGALKITNLMARRGWQWMVLSAIPFTSGVIAMVVSAGCNLGYINNGGELAFAVRSAAIYLGPLSDVFKTGIGLIFPIGVGVFALFDVKEFIDHAIESMHLEERAGRARYSSLWRKSFMDEQEKSIKASKPELAEICKADAQNMLKAVRTGDLSFGANELQKTVKSALPASGRVQITGAPAAQPMLPAGRLQQSQLPPPRTLPAQPPVNGQVSAPPAFSMGDTLPIAMPPLPMKGNRSGF